MTYQQQVRIFICVQLIYHQTVHPYYSDAIFTNIQSDIMNYSKNDDCIIFVGDFNARTSTNSDFVEIVGNKYLANTHNTFIAVGITRISI